MYLIDEKKKELLDLLELNHKKLNKSDLNILTVLKNDLKTFKLGSKIMINNKLFIVCKPYTRSTILLIDLKEGITHSDRKVDNEHNYITYNQLVFLAGTDNFTISDVNLDGDVSN